MSTVNTRPNMMSIDVEDWFQVENLKSVIQRRWDDKELRVEANTERILAVLEEADTKATFFTLGWIAERAPALVRKIAQMGHEVACHGYGHELIYDIGVDAFREDIRRSRAILEDITGQPVVGYRAPSFSITDQALEVLAEEGFLYDSSYFDFGAHERYGKLNTPRQKTEGSCLERYDCGLWEIPMATVRMMGKQLPISGGGYFRLLPYSVYKMLYAKAAEQLGNVVFYLHPWECDPGQPRVKGISAGHSFRHYINLSRTEGRLRRLVSDFEFTSIKDYIEKNAEK